MSGLAQGGYRDVSINFVPLNSATAAPAAPIEFTKAVTKQVEELEYLYNKKPGNVSDITAQTLYFSGRTPYLTFKATLTFVKATGVYTFKYLGTFPTLEAAQAATNT